MARAMGIQSHGNKRIAFGFDDNCAILGIGDALESWHRRCLQFDCEVSVERRMAAKRVETLTVYVACVSALSATIIGLTLLPAASVSSVPRCYVEGVEPIEINHGDRIGTLEETLANMERLAGSDAQSTEHIRQDIAAENAAYREAIEKLPIKCD